MHNFKGKDLYKVLGVNSSASKSDIKAAYRSLARKYHPDVNPGNSVSEKKFKDIGEAYEVLTHDSKRKQYDIINGYNKPSYARHNSAYQQRSQASKAYNQPKPDKAKNENKKTSSSSTPRAEKTDKPFNSAFSEFLDGVFNTKETKKTEQQAQPKRGSDISIEVSITANEATNGTVRKVNVLHTDPCKKCSGKRFINGSRCLHCEGNGEISNFKKINVKIPANVKENSKIRIAGEGNIGINGGESGDLFLVVNILRNDIFTFKDLNVFAEIPITPWEAVLGADIQVPTIDGFVSMKIPPFTTTGQKFKLSNQGLINESSKKQGDYVITTRIEVPKNIVEDEKKLYMQLAKLSAFNPRDEIINGK